MEEELEADGDCRCCDVGCVGVAEVTQPRAGNPRGLEQGYDRFQSGGKHPKAGSRDVRLWSLGQVASPL